jgi:hypothetical protein
VTGCLLNIVIAFLVASVLVAILATKDPTGNVTIPHQTAVIIGVLALSSGFGLWRLMSSLAKRFVSFSRRRSDPWR